MQKIISQIASELSPELGVSLQEELVLETIRLLDSGNTIPFIACYRKEVTGGLTEDQLRAFSRKLSQLRKLEARKWEVIKLISRRNKITEELRRDILDAKNLNGVEDLYLPYKPKRRTRATVAREKGLEPLAQQVLSQTTEEGTLDEHAASYIDPENGLNSTDDVFAEAKAIIAEIVAEDAQIREMTRRYTQANGSIVSQKSPALLAADRDNSAAETDNLAKAQNLRKANGAPQSENEAAKRSSPIKDKAIVDKYRDYFDYTERIANITPQTVLALNQGAKEKALTVKVSAPIEGIISNIEAKYISNSNSVFAGVMRGAVADSYERLLAPSIERDVKRDLTRMADLHALDAAAKKLRELLLRPPVRDKCVLAINPAYRTGCKIAVLSGAGDPITVDNIFPHHPRNEWQASKEKLCNLIREHDVDIIAIGDGAASRETEALVGEIISELNATNEGAETVADTSRNSDKSDAPSAAVNPTGRANDVVYATVNAAGASVYATSRAARDEFPKLNASARGAISIGRRLQDPLAELVKIDPKLTEKDLDHKINRKELGSTLNAVVESCVNYVGADLNTAPPKLLRNVSGLGRLTAEKIVEKRKQLARFTSREQLKEVDGINEQSYTQAAGFVRITNGDNPLDNTAIHPESYGVCGRLLSALNLSIDELRSREGLETISKSISELSAEEIAPQLSVSVPTLKDIFENMKNPGRDPREDLPPRTLKRDVLTMDDLQPGMKVKGTVRNIVDFGVFVDIGVKRDGLIHVSQLSDDYVKSPRDLVSAGDVVEVKVLAIDREKEKIKLTMRSEISRSQRHDETKGGAPAKSLTETGEAQAQSTAPDLSHDEAAAKSRRKPTRDSSGRDRKIREDRKPRAAPRRTPKDSPKRGGNKPKDPESRRDKRGESGAPSGPKLKDTPEWRSLLQKFGR